MGGLNSQTNILEAIDEVANLGSTSTFLQLYLRIDPAYSNTEVRVINYPDATVHFSMSGSWSTTDPRSGLSTRSFPFYNGNTALNNTLNITSDNEVGIGVGTQNPTTALEVRNDDGLGNGLHLIADINRAGGTDAQLILGYFADGTNATGPVVYAANGFPLLFSTGSVERMRLNPSAQTMKLTANTATGTNYIQFVNNAGTNQGYVGFGSSGTNDMYISQESSNVSIIFLNGGSERMRIDTNGNVGISNTSPSSYHANAKNLVVGNGGHSGISIVGGTTGRSSLHFADGTSGGDESRGYIIYRHTDNDMLFGTNDAEKMRMDSLGNLRVGTATPLFLYSEQNIAQVAVNRVSSNGTIIDTSRSAAFINLKASDGGSSITFHTANANNTSPPEKMVITSDGKVGIGTQAPTANLEVSGAGSTFRVGPRYSSGGDRDFVDLIAHGSDSKVLSNNERFHIENNAGDIILTSSKIGIGLTNPLYAKLVVTNSNVVTYNPSGFNNVNIRTQSAATPTTGSCTGITMGVSGSSELALLAVQNSSSYAEFVVQSYNGSYGERLRLNSSGTLTVTGDVVAYGSPSDKTFKENIKPVTNALDKVSKLQGVTFDWKESESILDIKEDIGFIAQDVQEVLPELVRENEDGKLSLRDKGIVPILVEAIKELKAEIEQLKKSK